MFLFVLHLKYDPMKRFLSRKSVLFLIGFFLLLVALGVFFWPKKSVPDFAIASVLADRVALDAHQVYVEYKYVARDLDDPFYERLFILSADVEKSAQSLKILDRLSVEDRVLLLRDIQVVARQLIVLLDEHSSVPGFKKTVHLRFLLVEDVWVFEQFLSRLP